MAKGQDKKIKEALEYYASDKVLLDLPTDSNFRHYRVVTHKGAFRKIPHKIRDPEDLQKWIIKFGGMDVFYGVTQWLNPQNISSKYLKRSGYHVIDSLMIKSDLVFDLDAPDPVGLKTLNMAKKVTKVIHEAMKKETRYKFQYSSFTGQRGFRLSYEDKGLKLPEDPKQRIPYLEKERKLFIEAFLKKIKQQSKLYPEVLQCLDIDITTDPMRIVRVLGTVHSKTGFLSVKITPTELGLSIDRILDKIPYIGKNRPGIPHQSNMKPQNGNSISRPRLESLAENVTGLASLPPTHERYFITNRVLGTKGYVPVFSYNSGSKYYIQEIKNLQEKHNLGPLYVYSFGDHTIILALKVMQRRQLEKVLLKSSSMTSKDFRKFRRILLPLNMQLVGSYPGKLKGLTSRSHLKYVNKEDIPNPRFAGWDKIEMIRAEIK